MAVVNAIAGVCKAIINVRNSREARVTVQKLTLLSAGHRHSHYGAFTNWDIELLSLHGQPYI